MSIRRYAACPRCGRVATVSSRYANLAPHICIGAATNTPEGRVQQLWQYYGGSRNVQSVKVSQSQTIERQRRRKNSLKNA